LNGDGFAIVDRVDEFSGHGATFEPIDSEFFYDWNGHVGVDAYAGNESAAKTEVSSDIVAVYFIVRIGCVVVRDDGVDRQFLVNGEGHDGVS